MLNKVVLIGRLTRDPEQRATSSGIAVTTFTLAVDRNFSNQQGEREADFIPVVVWRGLAETCGKYLDKGRLVAVSGRIQTRSYDTPEGQRRYITEVVGDEVQFLERSNRSGDAGGYGGNQQGPYTQQNQQRRDDDKGFHPIEGEDDELPF